MFKKPIIILLGAVFLGIHTVHAEDISRKLIKFTTTYSLNSYYDDSIVLLAPRKGGLESSFLSQGRSAGSIIKNQDKSCIAINGFYFGKGNDGDIFQPAGSVTLYQGLSKKSNLVPSTTNPEDDVNLGVNVFYNSLNNNLSFNTPISIAYGVSFFAGPMIIDHGTINPVLTNKTSHRSTAHYRTFIIQNQKNKAILGISKKKISLYELGEKLANIYTGENISVVNLDGGSSTSIAVSGYVFNATKTLPSRFTTCSYK